MENVTGVAAFEFGWRNASYFAAMKLAAKRVNAKNDPLLKAAARDLRNRWVNAVEQDPALLSWPHGDANASYDVYRRLELTPGIEAMPHLKRLESSKKEIDCIAA